MYEYEKTIPTLWGHVKGNIILRVLSPTSWPFCQDFVKENPQFVAKDNALGFMSENGGDSYNLCHCKPCLSTLQIYPSDMISQSGVTLRLRIWTSGEVPHILHSLNTSIRRADFITRCGFSYVPCTFCLLLNSVGETPLFTASLQLYLPAKINCSSSMRSVTSTIHTRIVPKTRKAGRGVVVHVINLRALVRFRDPPSAGITH